MTVFLTPLRYGHKNFWFRRPTLYPIELILALRLVTFAPLRFARLKAHLKHRACAKKRLGIYPSRLRWRAKRSLTQAKRSVTRDCYASRQSRHIFQSLLVARVYEKATSLSRGRFRWRAKRSLTQAKRSVTRDCYASRQSRHIFQSLLMVRFREKATWNLSKSPSLARHKELESLTFGSVDQRSIQLS